MLIVCPSCASEYALDPDRIGAEGRKVRCAMCRTTWFVRLPDGPKAEDAGPEPAPGTDESFPQTIDAVADAPASPPRSAAQRRPKPGGKKPSPGRGRERLALAAILVVLLATPAALALRVEVVRHVPSSASLFSAIGLGVNLLGLELAEVSAETVQEGTARALTIRGEIRSKADRPVLLPRLDFAIEDAHGASLYRWSAKPPVPELGPGESARFTARLASPPPDGARLVASFQMDGGDRSVALR